MGSDDDCSAALHLILEAGQVRLRLEASHFGHRRFPTSLLLVRRPGAHQQGLIRSSACGGKFAALLDSRIFELVVLRLPQAASSSFSGASIAGMSAGFITAMWPQAEATILTLAPGMWRASFSLSTGGK